MPPLAVPPPRAGTVPDFVRLSVAHEVRRTVEVGVQPCVGVEHTAACVLYAVDHPAMLGRDERGAGPQGSGHQLLVKPLRHP